MLLTRSRKRPLIGPGSLKRHRDRSCFSLGWLLHLFQTFEFRDFKSGTELEPRLEFSRRQKCHVGAQRGEARVHRAAVAANRGQERDMLGDIWQLEEALRKI